MSFLKKLFGLGSAPGAASRNQVIRPARVKVKELHRLKFRPVEGSGQLIRVGNVSHRGIGLIRHDLQEPHIGDVIRGNLEVNEALYDVQALVRHFTGQIVGCEFIKPSEILERAILEYFKMEIVGLSLNQVAESYLKADPLGQPHWFTDSQQNEIYYTIDQDGINAFHMSFLGNYIEGGRGKRTRSGHIVDHDETDLNYKGSALIDLSDEQSSYITELAVTMIESMESISIDHQKEFLKILTS